MTDNVDHNAALVDSIANYLRPIPDLMVSPEDLARIFLEKLDAGTVLKLAFTAAAYRADGQYRDVIMDAAIHDVFRKKTFLENVAFWAQYILEVRKTPKVKGR